MLTREDLEHRIKHHPPQSDEAVAAHEAVRAGILDFCDVLLEYVPESRERALAITNLEQSMMWANAAIARNQD